MRVSTSSAAKNSKGSSSSGGSTQRAPSVAIPNNNNNNNNNSIVNRTLHLFNASQQSTNNNNINNNNNNNNNINNEGPPVLLEAAPLSFIAANRTVAAFEKAVERLELLSLLDTTAPAEGPTRSFLPAINGADNNNNNIMEVDIDRQRTGTPTPPRKAALILNKPDEMSRKTIREMNAALQVAANLQRGGRPTVAELVIEQQRLEQRYGELLLQTKRVNPNPNEPELDKSCFASVQDNDKTAIMEELRQTSKKLREHNKALFIQLKDNPNDADNWKKVSNERSELIQLLQAVIRELTTGYGAAKPTTASGSSLARNNSRIGPSLRSESIGTDLKETASATLTKNRFGSAVQMKRANRGPAAPRIPLTSYFERFAKLISDEQSAQRWADEIVLKEKELNQNVKQLQHDLKNEKILKEKEINERRQRIAELKVSLREEKKKAKEQSEMVRAEVEAAHEAMQRSAYEEERIVKDIIRSSEQEETMEDRAHVAFKEHLIERTEAMEELAMQWDRKNQTEIKKVEARKIDVEQMRQQCAERLQKALKDKETEEELKAQRDEERRKEEAEKSAAEAQANLEYEAVSMIQSAIRGMFTRHALTLLKKKNKKKRKAEKDVK